MALATDQHKSLATDECKCLATDQHMSMGNTSVHTPSNRPVLWQQTREEQKKTVPCLAKDFFFFLKKKIYINVSIFA